MADLVQRTWKREKKCSSLASWSPRQRGIAGLNCSL